MSSRSGSSSAAAAHHGLTSAGRKKLLEGFKALYDNTVAHESKPSNPEHMPNTAIYRADDREEFFAEEIVFRDPLTQVTGLPAYKLEFASMHRTFTDIQMEVLSVTEGKGRTMIGSKANSGEESEMIIVESRCTYVVNRYIKFTIRQLSRLSLNDSGLIDSHEDLWSYADLLYGLPLFGSLYRFTQPLVGRTLSFVMSRWWGWKAGLPLTTRQLGLETNTLHAVYHPIESQKIAALQLKEKDAANDKDGANNNAGDDSDSVPDQLMNSKKGSAGGGGMAASLRGEHKSMGGKGGRGESKEAR